MNIVACRECGHPIVVAREGPTARWLPFNADPVQEQLKHSGRHFCVPGHHAVRVRLMAANFVARESITEEAAVAHLRETMPWFERHACRSRARSA